MRMRTDALLSVALLVATLIPVTAQPTTPPPADARTLLLDRFDEDFVPDGQRMTSPTVIVPAGEHTGGRLVTGGETPIEQSGEFIEGRFGQAFQFHGMTAMYYPVPGNIDVTAGAVEMWLRMGYEPVHPSQVESRYRNQLFLNIDPPGPARFIVYSTLVQFCVGVWDQQRQLVAYVGAPMPWHEGEWHHVEVRWGRRLELWLDGELRGSEDWAGLFGPMSVDLKQTQMFLGSRIHDSDIEAEFAVDELRILGPGGEQVPPYPLVTCPRIVTPPTLDGVLGDGEWDGAGEATGFVGLNDNRPVVDQTNVFVAHDERNLYVAFECTDPENRPLEGTFTDRDSAVYQEDAVDIFLQPGPDVYPYYQLVANCIGTRFDARAIEQNGRRAFDIEFDPEWTVATSRGEGRWVMETAIPWAELEGRSAPQPGERWRVNFCRDADAASRLSSWSWIAGNFHRPSNFGEMVFRGDDRAMRLSELTGLRDGRPHARLDLTGLAFDPPVTVTATLVDAGAATVAEAHKDLIDAKSFIFEPPPITSGDYVLTLTAATAEETLSYQRLPFSVDKPFDIAVAGYPYEGRLWVTASIGGMPDLPEGSMVRARLVAGEREAGACEITQFDRGSGQGAIDITQVEPGQYEVQASVVGPDGEVLAQAAAGWEQFDRPVFWMSDAGMERTVPTPWTPVEAAADAIRVWGREYRGDGRIMPGQIVNQGQDLLAGPIELTATVGGAAIDLSALPAAIVEAADDRAVQEAALDGPVPMTLRATTEYDGMQRYDLTISPAGEATVDALALAIPVRREVARFILPSSGRFSKPVEVGDESWRSAFMPQVWLGNDDLGLAWFAESDRYWNPVDDDTMLEVVPEGDVVTLRANIIREPRTITEPITITFGLIATPVKQVPTGDPWYFRFGAVNNAYQLYDPQASAIYHTERLEYPAAGNIDPAQGTLEFWLSAGGMGGGGPRPIAGIYGDGGSMVLNWDLSQDRLWLTVPGPEGELQIGATDAGVPMEGYVHVAATWGERIALYCNGRLLDSADGPLPAAEQMAASPEKLRLVLGSAHGWRGWTWFDVDEVRVSGTVRYAGDGLAVPTEPFAPDEATLLLDHLDDRFRPDGEDAETRPEVMAAPGDHLGGLPSIGCEFVDGVFGSGLQVGVVGARPCKEMLQEWGVDAYNLWSWLPKPQWDEVGWPLPLFTEPEGVDLPRMNAAFDEAGVRTSTYMGYMGIGAPTRWSRQFGYEWRREPVSSQPSEPPPGHSYLDCCGNARGYADYLAEGTRWLLEEQGFDGCYTDGNAHVYPCRNTHHGCGYYDDDGTLRPTYPVFGTREYLERMYRIIHEHGPDGFLVNHVSYNIFIPTMSFTDVYYTGEHEHYEDLLKCRVRWQGTQWGIWPILLGADSHTYEAMYYTYGLLHGTSVWVEGPLGRNDMLRKTVNLWRAYDDFGYREAQWIPYYRAEESGIARADDDEVKVSLYLREGEGAFLVVGNLRAEVTECTVAVDMAQMGLGEDVRAWNALSERELPMADGRISVRLRPNSFVLARLERR